MMYTGAKGGIGLNCCWGHDIVRVLVLGTDNTPKCQCRYREVILFLNMVCS